MQLLGTLSKLAIQTGDGLVGGVYKELGNLKLRANGCINSYQTMLRIVASVLVVACKRMQQLPTMLAHHGCWSVTRSYCFAVSNRGVARIFQRGGHRGYSPDCHVDLQAHIN